ncbi:MAG: hypothetical protein WDW20_04470 [Neisseriaceae bacterium]
MTKKPEEIILAALGIVWMFASYFLARYLGMDIGTSIQLLLYNAVWVIFFYSVWKNAFLYLTWPVFLGAFIAAWTPLLDGYAQLHKPGSVTTQSLSWACAPLPWYATWYFKFILVMSVVFIGYLILLIKNRKIDFF